MLPLNSNGVYPATVARVSTPLAARVPWTQPIPPAPWSVPCDSFASGRRPNSDHTTVSTRSATPRASRSAWKAVMLSDTSFSRSTCSVSCPSWVSKPPLLNDITRVPNPAPSIRAPLRMALPRFESG